MANLQRYFHKFCVRNSKLARHNKLVSFYEKNVDRSRTRVLIACMPKSASTYMTELLRYYLNFPVHDLIRTYGRCEQEISWSKLASVMDSDALFAHHHVRASESTLKIVRLFNVHTLVMIRNLFDAVISFRDHLVDEGLENPQAYVQEEFLEWERRRQYEFIIDLILPWYLNFLVSWIEAKKHPDIRLLWINYSDWIYQPEATLKRIGAFCGLDHSDEAAARAVVQAKKKPIRLNVGRPGRGLELLDDELQAKVEHLFSYYPCCEPYRHQLLSQTAPASLTF
ncbi:MAG TPA: sulfotransferase domain-containing protein [Candidatus Methylacidiphilales bacterium]|nr:sulfotransferase domain-containing protein [Candidatus Methylacidiphilales bacterium]